MKNVLRISVLIFLIISYFFDDWEYEYGLLQIFKIGVTIFSLFIAYFNFKVESFFYSAFYLFLAIIFFPFIPIQLETEVWQMIDLIVISFLIIELIVLWNKQRTQSLKSILKQILIELKYLIVVLFFCGIPVIFSIYAGNIKSKQLSELESELSILNENIPYKLKVCNNLLDYNTKTIDLYDFFNNRYESKNDCLDTITSQKEMAFVYNYINERYDISIEFDDFKETLLSDNQSDSLFQEMLYLKNEISELEQGIVYTYLYRHSNEISVLILFIGILFLILFRIRYHLKRKHYAQQRI